MTAGDWIQCALVILTAIGALAGYVRQREFAIRRESTTDSRLEVLESGLEQTRADQSRADRGQDKLAKAINELRVVIEQMLTRDRIKNGQSGIPRFERSADDSDVKMP